MNDNENFMDKFQMVCAVTELSLRCSGGRMVRTNMIEFCRETYGTTGKTNKKVLGEMLFKWEETYGKRFDFERAYENAGLPTQKAEA